MPYGLNRGLGVLTQYEYAQCNAQFLRGILNPFCWQTVAPASQLAVPPAPTGDALTVPPESGQSAAELQQSLADEQMRRQQAIDAANVKSTWSDQLSSDIVDTTNSLTNPGGLSWVVWGAIGLAVFGVVAFSGGSARRYGR